jgi:LuxR family maltose regulon positive regulatory protein
MPTAWYSVDEHDNDLVRFLTYLVSALETVQIDVGRQALDGLSTRRRPSLESVITSLSNDIATIPQDFVLVLDDYHRIELLEIHEAITFLLDSPQPHMHLVIATRADPPLPLARLRARGQLAELRVPDLRFTVNEAAEFLNDRMNLNLVMEQVSALEERAEGWIAGLQLAALSMRGRQDVAGFIQGFTGTHRFILDYLSEEVLQRQTSEIQTFLLQTSLLDQMNASLTDAITGRDDSGQFLMQLEKANLFVIPLDDERQWYRYHHLFADFLRSYLQQSQPEQVPELHRRASAWYAQNGFIHEAVDHTLSVPDFELAACLIEQKGMELVI